MITKFGRKQNSFLRCKLFYYIFVKVSIINHDVNSFIYVPIFSFNEVKLILKGDLLIQFIAIISLGLVLHYALMDVAICGPHVNSQLFPITNIIS